MENALRTTRDPLTSRQHRTACSKLAASVRRSAWQIFYDIALIALLVAALVFPIASTSISVKALVENVLLSMETPLSLAQAEQMLSMVGVTLPEDTKSSYNVLGAVRTLFVEKHYLAGGIVAVGSVLLPILKVAICILPKLHGRIWDAVRFIAGRFALLDVLVVAVLVVAVSTVSGWSVTIGPAAWFYVGFAVLYCFAPKGV